MIEKLSASEFLSLLRPALARKVFRELQSRFDSNGTSGDMNADEGQISEVSDGKSRLSPQTLFRCPPRILKLPLATEVRQENQFWSLSDAESHLVRLGFGPAFSFEQHKSLGQVERSFRIAEAEARLNEKLRRILPVTML